jgi:Trk K+ transport system NAD-binding subunit
MMFEAKSLKEIKLKENGHIFVAPSKKETIMHGDRILVIGRPENFSEVISTLTKESTV